ncbi:MAG: flagellar biosynthesis protein FlhB [Xanthomonadaceae bacterium]|nr:flagellar biosynthesis protein FlhB [Xanthomonadaceae bacterium]
MAETEQHERTEQPTAKRLQEARDRGEIPRSRELAGAAVTVAVLLSLMLVTGPATHGARALLQTGLVYRPEQLATTQVMTDALGEAIKIGWLVIAVPLIVAAIAALVGTLGVGGWMFSTEALAPKPERLDPISGFKRLFSLRGVVELGKSFAKFLVVALIAWWLLSRQLPVFASIALEPVGQGIMHALRLIGWSAVALSSGLILIAAVDAPWQIFDFNKRMRMTREELKREQKESDGNPEVRSKIRQLQQQAARRKMIAEVPKADVVVTNPTHFAVALRYDEKTMRAPIVVAKGADLMAAQIRAIAGEHRVAIVEAPPLARALYRHTDIGQPVPTALYLAVAQVLAYVFRLRRALRYGEPMPDPPQPQVDPSLLGPLALKPEQR